LWQSVSKHLQRWYRGRLPQTMVDSWYCLDRVVPEGISQVSRWSEVRNHKRRSLNTRLSFDTSAGIFACPVRPYRKCWGEAGTKNEPNRYFVPDRKNGPKIDPQVSNLRFYWFRFRGVQVHPKELERGYRGGDGSWKAKKERKQILELHAK